MLLLSETGLFHHACHGVVFLPVNLLNSASGLCRATSVDTYTPGDDPQENNRYSYQVACMLLLYIDKAFLLLLHVA